jgi:hypothetical protein
VSSPRRSSRPSPVTLGQGLATWAVYLTIKRLTTPIRWALKQVRRALFNWTDYTRYLREQSIVEGIFGGRKLWIALGGLLWGARAIRRASSRTERVVLREVMQPGDRIVISQLPRKPPRPSRRAAREQRAS